MREALSRDFAFPCSVFGPVLSFELRRLASICAAVAMGVKSQKREEGNQERHETHEKMIRLILPWCVLSLLMIRPAPVRIAAIRRIPQSFFDDVGGEAHGYAETTGHATTPRREWRHFDVVQAFQPEPIGESGTR